MIKPQLSKLATGILLISAASTTLAAVQAHKVNCSTIACFKEHICKPLNQSVNKILHSLANQGKVPTNTTFNLKNCPTLLALPGVVANPCGTGDSCYNKGQNKKTYIQHICNICLAK
jgi:hypothetical protein